MRVSEEAVGRSGVGYLVVGRRAKQDCTITA